MVTECDANVGYYAVDTVFKKRSVEDEKAD